MNENIKCDICGGTDYSDLKTCHICNRNYCEICESVYNPEDTCELCDIYDNNED